MASRNSASTVSNQMRTLFDVGALGATPDRGLLDHFSRGGESSEAAFATLVERHGTMVLRVCRQLLADSHLAEDAFQVTFLLLARRACSIHNPDALAAWLHRVARRVALRTLGGIRLRNTRERPQTGEIAVAAAAANADFLERAETCAIVHEEIDRLAEAQRLPILLCALEGLSHEEAAQRLRWPVGTVKSRLVRGRRRLETRLARRGLAPAVVLAAGLAAKPAGAAPVPLVLAMATTQAALQGTTLPAGTLGPVSISASSSIPMLLEKELSAIFLAKVGLATAVGLTACAAAVVIGLALAAQSARKVQALTPRPQQAQAGESKAPLVFKAGFTSLQKTDHRTPERQPTNPVGNQENPIVTIPERHRSALSEQVERAIRAGVEFLKAHQRPNGSWPDVENEAKTGTTSLVTLALLSSGEKSDLPAITQALEFLRRFHPNDLRSTYAISLQTQVFAAAEPQLNMLRIAANVRWLESAQFRAGEPVLWPGSWTYSDSKRGRPGDNSNTQFALAGLAAASEAGMPVNASVWERSRSYWARSQKHDGGWAYTPEANAPTASMTCAGISSSIIAAHGRSPGRESLKGDVIKDCGKGAPNRNLQAGIDWLAGHFRINENFGAGKQWRFYYLYGLERRAASRHPVSRRARLVSRLCRRTGPRTGRAGRILARRTL